MLGGTAVLTIPHAERVAVGLPFVPKMYAPHLVNWRAMEALSLDSSIMSPGPMVAEPGDEGRVDLRVSRDVLPYPVPNRAG